MSETIDASRMAEQLPELLERARAGERFVIQSEGLVVAELSPAVKPAMDPLVAEREEAFARLLEERGMITRRRSGPVIYPTAETLITVEGEPISEQIIRERG